MNKATILLVAVSAETNRAVAQFGSTWISTRATSAEEAIEKFQQLHQDIVILGNDLGETDIQKLTKLFLAQHDGLLIVRESNELSADGLLAQLKAKQKANKPAINFNDDALKNAGLNIQIQ